MTNEELQTQVDNLGNSIVVLENDLEAVREENAKLLDELKIVNEQKDNFVEQIKNLDAQVQELEAVNSDLAVTNVQLTQKIEILSKCTIWTHIKKWFSRNDS